MFLTFREKMEIRYLVYFLFNQKGFRPSLPPKLLAITAGAAIIFFLLAKAEDSLKQRYLFWKEGNSSGEIKEWIASLEIEAKQGKFSFER